MLQMLQKKHSFGLENFVNLAVGGIIRNCIECTLCQKKSSELKCLQLYLTEGIKFSFYFFYRIEIYSLIDRNHHMIKEDCSETTHIIEVHNMN